MTDFEKIRSDFPILSEHIYGKPLVYLDNGATTQKPEAVIHAIKEYYESYNSNVHRGVHFLSQKATDAEEAARASIQKFINAAQSSEIIFTKGTTDSINLLAYSFCKKHLQPGDEIIITEMEHHSNIVPWQMACEDRGGVIKVIPLKDDGTLDLSVLETLISSKTKLIAFTWVSNTLGTVNPVAELISLAHSHNIPVMIDAAQAIQHMSIDVQASDIDFLVFSGHKIYGPTGIGVLYGKHELLSALPPYQGGGSMIKSVTLKGTTYADLPFRFEAGTPNIAGIIGLGAAINYVAAIGLDNIAAHEAGLLAYAESELQQIPGIRIIGTAPHKAATISFLVGNIHPYDIGELLDKQGVAVRTGHHCCQPIMDRYEIPGTVRVSFALYNRKADVDSFITALKKAISMLA
ncbi:MAG: cysteine sulfinate desulfinase [Bacteroidetes bacterium 43-16]|nr:MAG: cysteine sulfinate desulfinase [Bacteroidetes bacterium 43-16]